MQFRNKSIAFGGYMPRHSCGAPTGINFALLKDCFPAYGPPAGAQPARVGQVASLQMPSARACSPPPALGSWGRFIQCIASMAWCGFFR